MTDHYTHCTHCCSTTRINPNGWCYECNRAYREAHAEHRYLVDKRYRWRRSAELAEYHRNYYAEHREAIIAQIMAHRQEKREMAQ